MSEQPDQQQEQQVGEGGGVSEATAVTVASTDPTASTAAEQSGAAESTPVVDSTAASDATSAANASGVASETSTPASAPESAKSAASSRSPKSHHSKTDAAEMSATGQQQGITTSETAKRISPASSSHRDRGTSHDRRKRAKLGELKLEEAKIGFLGAGKMTESIINGLIHYAKILPGKIHVAAPSSKGLERFKALGCRVTKRNYDIFGRYDCDIVFLCFHGYVIKHCYKLGGARPHPLTTNYIPHQRHPVYILSLVSGVTLSQIKACLLNPESTSRYVIEIHRIMMNTAVGHGLGICAIDCEPDSKKLSAPLRQLLSSIAQLENVPAPQMDAACAIGGSGLAFSYYFINALADGAFKMGLSRQQAIKFASKTAQCAAQTMLESGKHPAELRDNVSSPSGAAIYGIHVLEKNDVASGVTAAVEAAHKRANDLATQETST